MNSSLAAKELDDGQLSATVMGVNVSLTVEIINNLGRSHLISLAVNILNFSNMVLL